MVGEQHIMGLPAFSSLLTLYLPFFGFHLHHQQPKEAAPKALTVSQAQEDSLPLTPGETKDSHWRGQAHTSQFKTAELSGEWLWTEPHQYMILTTLCQSPHH